MEKARSGTTESGLTEEERQRAIDLIAEAESRKHSVACDGGPARKVKEFKPITPITAAELDELEIQPIDWLVKDILPVGLSILGAPSKYYKSYMALGLCVAICQGATFLDLIAQNMRVYISIWKVRNGARKIDLIKL